MVLVEQRSLGMLGIYSLGIIFSSVVCTVYIAWDKRFICNGKNVSID